MAIVRNLAVCIAFTYERMLSVIVSVDTRSLGNDQQAYLTSPFCAKAEGEPIDLNTTGLPDDAEVRNLVQHLQLDQC